MKTAQLQIRLSPAQKALVKRRAQSAGQDVSRYVLSRVAPEEAVRLTEILQALQQSDGGRFELAELSDFLTDLARGEFEEAVASAPLEGLSPLPRNLVAAMVEHAAAQKGAEVPSWTREVPPLTVPWFATDLGSLRAHLLRVSPTAYRRRNLFVDSTVGDRV